MKRVAILAAALLTLLLLAAATNSSITVKPSDLKDGETKVVTADGKKITISRDGNVTHLTISDDGTIRIDRRRPLVVAPHVRPNFPHQTWFECPKDHAMLRVPEGKEHETFKCPIDGTVMEKRKGRGFAFFFNDDWFEGLDALEDL